MWGLVDIVLPIHIRLVHAWIVCVFPSPRHSYILLTDKPGFGVTLNRKGLNLRRPYCRYAGAAFPSVVCMCVCEPACLYRGTTFNLVVTADLSHASWPSNSGKPTRPRNKTSGCLEPRGIWPRAQSCNKVNDGFHNLH